MQQGQEGDARWQGCGGSVGITLHLQGPGPAFQGPSNRGNGVVDGDQQADAPPRPSRSTMAH